MPDFTKKERNHLLASLLFFDGVLCHKYGQRCGPAPMESVPFEISFSLSYGIRKRVLYHITCMLKLENPMDSYLGDPKSANKTLDTDVIRPMRTQIIISLFLPVNLKIR